MKAVLSNRIYLSVNKEQTNQLERELTYTIAPRIPRVTLLSCLKHLDLLEKV